MMLIDHDIVVNLISVKGLIRLRPPHDRYMMAA